MQLESYELLVLRKHSTNDIVKSLISYTMRNLIEKQIATHHVWHI